MISCLEVIVPGSTRPRDTIALSCANIWTSEQRVCTISLNLLTVSGVRSVRGGERRFAVSYRLPQRRVRRRTSRLQRRQPPLHPGTAQTAAIRCRQISGLVVDTWNAFRWRHLSVVRSVYIRRRVEAATATSKVEKAFRDVGGRPSPRWPIRRQTGSGSRHRHAWLAAGRIWRNVSDSVGVERHVGIEICRTIHLRHETAADRARASLHRHRNTRRFRCTGLHSLVFLPGAKKVWPHPSFKIFSSFLNSYIILH